MHKEKNRTDENDFAALEKLASNITLDRLRPLTPAQKLQWNGAKRSRPRRNSAANSVPTLITVESKLLRRADAYARKAGLSRSQLFSDALKQRIKSAT